MKKRITRTLAMLLMIAMLLPLITVMTVASAEEVLLYGDDFSRLSGYDRGQKVTKSDGFAAVPSSTSVQRHRADVVLQIDFASGYENPDDTVYYIPGGSYEIVEEGTEGALCTDMASYGLISGKDSNLDKALQMNNPAISHTEYRTVVIEVKYYFEKGSNGSIHAQLQSYRTEGESKGWFALFNIDPETAMLNTGGHVTSKELRLEYGEWNTVSMVIDLVKGTADYYLNYVLHSSAANLGATNIDILANTLSVAKVHRTANVNHIASEELNGSFCVDDVRIYTPGENSFVSVPKENAQGEPFLEATLWKNGSAIGTYAKNYNFLCTDGVSVTTEYFHVDAGEYVGILSSLGASLRTDEHGGLRFVSALNAEKYETLLEDVENGRFASISFGTLIAPVKYIEQAGGFTFSALSKLNNRVNFLDVPSEGYGKWYFSDGLSVPDGSYAFAGTISGIDASHADDAFAGRGYIRVTHQSGVSTYLYSDWDGSDMTLNNAVSELLASGEELAKETRAFLEASILTPIADFGGEVWDISFSQNRLFFRLDEDIFACLTYTGNGGWRLKVQADGYLGFTGMGAAQALAYYMDEEPDETVLPITYEVTDKMLSVYCEDGSRVEISLAENFAMRVFSAAGKEVSHLLDIGMVSNTLVMRGRLDATEGVYGGGEKFDSVNRRGTLTRLYSTDGWNRSETSYMIIPLFFTSRGGGFFFNRYEDMLADFGSSVSNEWTLTLKNDAMDCYLYATESGKEVIANYARMTGTTTVPDEWAYGEMICRYSTDLKSFETDVDTTNKDGAPSGRSVKTLVTNLIEAGMKPSAMVMEPWGYGTVSYNESSREELQKTIDWLEEQGIRTMLYMRVGSSVNASMVGYKDEYFVYASITENGEDRYSQKIPDVANGGVSGNPDVSSSSSGHLYLDVTNPEAVEWYCGVIWGQLVDMGIDGVKIDFCETMPDEGYVYDYPGGSVVVNRYDWYDRSKMAIGGEHHSYPVYFISTFYKAMNERKLANGETDGFYVLSRGGGVGSQRNAFLWAGDQCREFDKLDDQLMSVVTSGLSGVPNMSYDMGGYRYNGKVMSYANEDSLRYESEVFSRAVEFTAFMVNIQTHGTVRNAYELTDGAQEIYRIYTQIHEDLIPLLTKHMTLAEKTGIPAVRHPVLEYQDDVNVYNINDQFLLGDGLMVAPILWENTYERGVYLPEGSWTNLLTGETLTGGRSYTVSANIGQVPVFLNNDSEDAEALLEVFSSDTWKKVKEWRAPLDSTAVTE